MLVAKPWLTGRASAAVLTRKIDALEPTLLLDESDAAFHGDREYAEALRGILNTGHRRGGAASLCVGKGSKMTWKDFQTYCPKALAGIGHLPDTVSDRSLPIRLKRKSPDERILERFRPRLIEDHAGVVRQDVAKWANGHLNALRARVPELPESLTDRQQDGVEPLLAIADDIGGEWPERSRTAIVEIFGGAAGEDPSYGVKLLGDIRQVFDSLEADRLSSQELIACLVDIETSPWSEWKSGKPLSPVGLSRLLRPFEIAPRAIRFEGTIFKGYLRHSFEDVWRRYLKPSDPMAVTSEAVDPSQPSRISNGASRERSYVPSQSLRVTDSPSASWPVLARVVPPVTDRTRKGTSHGIGSTGCRESAWQQPCYACHTTNWWERSDGGRVCGTCHPP